VLVASGAEQLLSPSASLVRDDQNVRQYSDNHENKDRPLHCLKAIFSALMNISALCEPLHDLRSVSFEKIKQLTSLGVVRSDRHRLRKDILAKALELSAPGRVCSRCEPFSTTTLSVPALPLRASPVR
jgi:hypothetical protein